MVVVKILSWATQDLPQNVRWPQTQVPNLMPGAFAFAQNQVLMSTIIFRDNGLEVYHKDPKSR